MQINAPVAICARNDLLMEDRRPCRPITKARPGSLATRWSRLPACAIRSTPGIVVREALAVRRRAVDDAAGSLSASALLLRAIELILTSRPKA